MLHIGSDAPREVGLMLVKCAVRSNNPEAIPKDCRDGKACPVKAENRIVCSIALKDVDPKVLRRRIKERRKKKEGKGDC